MQKEKKVMQRKIRIEINLKHKLINRGKYAK